MKRITLFLLLPLMFSSAQAQDNTGDRFISWLIKDPGEMVKNFGEKEIAGVLFSGMVLGILSAHDEVNSNVVSQKFEGALFLRITEEFGAIKYAAPGAAGLFGVSLLTGELKFQDAAFTSFQSVIYTAGVVGGLKFSAGRERPYELDGSRDFDFFEAGNTSFPSGHASTAFALVVPWVVYYPGIVTYAMLTIPVGTAISRIAERKHWLTDVSAGAIIGSYIGYSLAKKHMNDQREPRFDVTPFVLDQGAGLSLRIDF